MDVWICRKRCLGCDGTVMDCILEVIEDKYIQDHEYDIVRYGMVFRKDRWA